MANKPIIGNVTVNSTAKTLSGGRLNIGGVWKTVAESYECVNGVWKPSWKRGYTWKKYTATAITSYSVDFSGASQSLKLNSNTRYTIAKSYSVDSNGNPVLAGTQTSQNPNGIASFYTTYPYMIDGGVLYNIIGKSGNSMAGYTFTVIVGVISSHVSGYQCGSYIADVTSETADAYPTNGRHTDGYWYVFQG